MAFFKSLIIASVAAVALAQGGASDNNKKVEIDTKAGDYKCGNGQKVACCNSGEDLIGLNCLSVPIRMSLSLPLPPEFYFHRRNRNSVTNSSSSQSPSPSRRPAVPTLPPAARLATPTATSSTSRPTALPSLFKRFHSSLKLSMMPSSLLW